MHVIGRPAVAPGILPDDFRQGLPADGADTLRAEDIVGVLHVATIVRPHPQKPSNAVSVLVNDLAVVEGIPFAGKLTAPASHRLDRHDVIHPPGHLVDTVT